MATKEDKGATKATVQKVQAQAKSVAAGKAADAARLQAQAKAVGANKPKTVVKPDTKTGAVTTPGAAKSVVSVDTYTDANGNRIEVTTFSDGSKTTRNLGIDAGVLTQRTNWIEKLKADYTAAGLGSLADRIIGFVQQGFDPETIEFKITETPEYKMRFPANEARKKANLPVLSLDEYIAAENAYRSIFRSAGFSKGFYDSNDDFTKFLENDMSPAELKSRVDMASLAIESADPYFSDSLQRFYGIPKADMVAYVLDPERAMPLITRQIQAAQIGAEAGRQGLNIGVATSESLRNLGVTQEQARTGFESVAQIAPIAQKLSQITAGESIFGTEQATTAVFGGEQSAEQKRRLQRLADIEQSRFAGQAGVGSPSLGMSKQGQF